MNEVDDAVKCQYQKVSKEEVPEKDYNGFGIRHMQMACMLFCVLTLYIGRSCISVAVLAMTDENRRNDTNVMIFDWDKHTQSVILSSFFWGYTAMQFFGGMLARRFGGKPTLLVSLLANGTLFLLLPTIAQIGGWKMVCAARVAMGLTQACLFPSIHTLLGRWLPAHERTTYTGVVYAGIQVGVIAANPMSGLLADTAMGWKIIFYAISGLLFTTALLWYFLASSSPRSHRLITKEEIYYIEKTLGNSSVQGSLRTPWKQILKSKPMWAILVTQMSCGVSFVVFFFDLPTFLEKGLGMSLKNSALLSILPFIGMGLSSVGASLLSNLMLKKGLLSTIGCRKLFNSIALTGTSIGLVGLSFLGPDSYTLAITVVVAAMTMNGCSTAGYLVNVLDITPNYAGVLVGVTNTANAGGSVVTPLLTSLILRNDPTDNARWHMVFLLFAGLNVVCNIIYLLFATAERQEWDDPHFMDRIKDEAVEELTELKHQNKNLARNLAESHKELK